MILKYKYVGATLRYWFVKQIVLTVTTICNCRYMLFRAGVPRHSIIKKFAGEDISRLEDLISVLSKLSRGSRVPLEYINYKERHQRKVLATLLLNNMSKNLFPSFIIPVFYYCSLLFYGWAQVLVLVCFFNLFLVICINYGEWSTNYASLWFCSWVLLQYYWCVDIEGHILLEQKE